jgi:hypothetical protein
MHTTTNYKLRDLTKTVKVMRKTLAVITATVNQNYNDSDILMYAELTGIHNPMWKIHIEDKEFNFFPNKKFIFQDGLWQLSLYLDIPKGELSFDVNNNPPDDLENEFGIETCNEYRTHLSSYLSRTPIYYTIVIDNNNILAADVAKLANQLTKSGANITMQHSSLTNLLEPKIHKMNPIKQNKLSFEQRVNQLITERGLPPDQIILNDFDIRNLFDISRRTSFKYRKLLYFPYHKFPQGRVYYILSEIINSIKNN